MVDRLIIDCSTGKLIEHDYTEEEKQVIEQQKALEQVTYSVVEKKPSQAEIEFAEYVLATEDRIAQLESKINGGAV